MLTTRFFDHPQRWSWGWSRSSKRDVYEQILDNNRSPLQYRISFIWSNKRNSIEFGCIQWVARNSLIIIAATIIPMIMGVIAIINYKSRGQIFGWIQIRSPLLQDLFYLRFDFYWICDRWLSNICPQVFLLTAIIPMIMGTDRGQQL